MGSVVKKTVGSFFGGAEAKAGRALERGQRASAAEFRRAGEDIQELFEPQVELGQTALQLQAALSGVRGPEEEARAIAEFQESPAQRFLRERAEKTLLRRASAIGGLGGGNIRKALQEQAIGIAAQQLQDRLANIAGITELGQRGLTQTGQGIQFGTGGVSQGLIGAAQGRAAGITGEAAGFRSGVQDLIKGIGSFLPTGVPAP